MSAGGWGRKAPVVLSCLPALLWLGAATSRQFFNASASSLKTSPEQSKVILITVDTLRADHLACYGDDRIRTPNIDRLAADGIRFANAVAQVPLTLPSHCSILTGTYPVFHGVHDQGGYLPQNRPTLAKFFKARGFSTAAFVSAFVLNSRFGLSQGFDHYDDAFDDNRVSSPNELERRGDQTLARALAWIENYAGTNFFVWLHFYDPHVPYSPPEPFKTRYAHRPYDGEIAFVDSVVGELIRFLDKKGWYSEALVVFTADHGEDLGDHGENTHGFFVYESTLRIPLVIKTPGNEFRGRVISEQVQSLDIAPTILQLLSLPPGGEMQGRGLLSLIEQKGWRAPPAVGETYYPFYHFGWSPLRFLRTERYKYIEAPQPELYDLSKDPREANNIIASNRTLANELRKQLFDAIHRFRGDRSPPAPTRGADQATLEKLRSLGYIGFAAPRSVSDLADYRQLADPKAKLGAYHRLQSALLDEQNHRLPQAIHELSQLIESDPNLIDAYLDLGLCYKRLGQYGNAIEQFKAALQRDPANAIASYNLAHSYALSGKIEQAVIGFERTLQLDPRETRAHVGLGITYELKGNIPQAVAEYEVALGINPSDSVALSHLGAALLRQGSTDKAIAYFGRALEINPNDAETHNTLGSALLMRGDLAPAIARFRHAIELNPRFADSYTNLGLALMKEGNFQEAIANLKRALEINPSSASSHYLMGQAYAAQGMEQAAQGEFEIARKLGYR